MSKVLRDALNSTMIKDVPSYGNKFFYSLGFLSMLSFVVLLVTGIIMAFYGPTWWLTSDIGKYTRSVHMWATQAFVLFIILHLLVVFFTSGFKKPRRFTWVLGVLMLFAVLMETEFGYVLRGDFASQWRALQGADFYNGSGLGWMINPLNYKQIYGIHIAVIPFVIVGLLMLHYLLVRFLGIAKPYRQDVQVKTVPANHTKLFVRGGVLVGLILILAVALPSPFIKPTTVKDVADHDPYLMQKTLLAEYTAQSDTATYVDNIAPYTFSTKNVYVTAPYQQWLTAHPGSVDQLALFNSLPDAIQSKQLKALGDYYAEDTPTGKISASPLNLAFVALTAQGQAGLYEPGLAGSNGVYGDGLTYSLRFLADTGVLDAKAEALAITTEQYGMIREETGHAPGAWWLSPIGLLNHSVLSNDDNGDRDAAIIFGSLLLTMLAFPFIPWINQIPDKLRVWKLIWREKKA